MLEQIKKEVETLTGIEKLEIKNRKRDRVTARYMYICLGYNFTLESYDRIGSEVNGDHCMVIYAIDNLKMRLFYDKEFKEIYEQLFEKYKQEYGLKDRKNIHFSVNTAKQRKKVIRKLKDLKLAHLRKVEGYINELV